MKSPGLNLSKSYWARLQTFAISAGLLSLAIAQPVLSQEKILRTLSVTGRGTERIATSMAQIRLGVEAQGKTADDVQQEVARRSSAVITILKARGVEKLETTGINLSPAYRYDNGTQTLVGYTASNIVSFRVDTSKAGSLLDEAVKAGATRIDGVSFIATDAAIAAAQKVALRAATQDAQSQSDVVLNALGLTKREVVGIQINGAFAPPPRPLAADNFALAKGGVPVPVIGGEQQVEASVTLQISY